MPRPGYKAITVPEDLYSTIEELAKIYGYSMAEMVDKLYSTFVAKSYAPFAEFRGLFRKK